MEKERKKLDKQLDHALEKAKAANHGQEVLETKIKVSILAYLFNSRMWSIATNSILEIHVQSNIFPTDSRARNWRRIRQRSSIKSYVTKPIRLVLRQKSGPAILYANA